jgi:hypothetical protein
MEIDGTIDILLLDVLDSVLERDPDMEIDGTIDILLLDDLDGVPN